MSLVKGRDRISVSLDGETEIRVWNHATVTTCHYVNSANGYETPEVRVARGMGPDGASPPFITERLADVLRDEFGVNLDHREMEVIDVQSGDVEVL